MQIGAPIRGRRIWVMAILSLAVAGGYVQADDNAARCTSTTGNPSSRLTDRTFKSNTVQIGIEVPF
jgi:hypothetical protein